MHLPGDLKNRLIPAYFVNDIQREIFGGLKSTTSTPELIAQFQRQGDDEAAHVLSQLVVDEVEREYTADDVTAVVSQLIRSAVALELRNVDREVREGTIAPDVAMATIRDVKERVELLDSPNGDIAEGDLRSWLVERSTTSLS
jgi:hypothetical protein